MRIIVTRLPPRSRLGLVCAVPVVARVPPRARAWGSFVLCWSLLAFLLALALGARSRCVGRCSRSSPRSRLGLVGDAPNQPAARATRVQPNEPGARATGSGERQRHDTTSGRILTSSEHRDAHHCYTPPPALALGARSRCAGRCSRSSSRLRLGLVCAVLVVAHVPPRACAWGLFALCRSLLAFLLALALGACSRIPQHSAPVALHPSLPRSFSSRSSPSLICSMLVANDSRT